VGLIARHAEANGISTVCLSSALDITRSVNPPRAAFLDFPLGHTSGKANEPALQDSIVRDALHALEGIEKPGTVKILSYRWGDDESWKNLPDSESRLPRTAEPQFQTEEDRILYEKLWAAKK
jgi:D-proline reductase (dithiol) PrdB